MALRRGTLTVLLTCAVALPLVAAPAAAAVPAGEPVVVAALVRTDDGGYEVRRTRASSPERGRSLAAQLRAGRDVVDAEVEGVVTAFELPSADPLQAQQWGLEAVRAPQSWDLGDAAGQVVAVVDSGVDAAHPDLAAALVPGYDFVRQDAVADDENGHGTHVAGVVAAVAGNGVGVAGAALRAKVLPVKVLDATGAGSTADVAAGIRWALDHGATVINLSLGGPQQSSMVTSAIETALSRGVPVVAAAGNESSSTPNWPAAQPGVVAVGAVDRFDSRASFSNTGNHLAVVAPGVGVLSTLPSSRYGTMSGTSMAAPFVAGALAQLRVAAPTAAPGQLRQALTSTAVDLGLAGPDTWYGAGRVDVAAAVAALLPAAPEPAPEPAAPPTTEPEPATEPEPTTGPEPVLEPAPVLVPVPAEPLPTPLPTGIRTLDRSCPTDQVRASGFTDVLDTSTHSRAISCLVWWGVAQGRTSTTYDPASGVTRDAMATFVARAVLAARPDSLPLSPPNAFTDDDASAHWRAVDQLAAVGIVGGTGPGTYSPRAPVTRGQMAKFLANAAAFVLGAPLPAGPDQFADTRGSVFQADIDRVAHAGLTGGTSPGSFSPGLQVTRAQMGGFLARTLDLFVANGAQLPAAS